jgi:superoxide dismutase
MSVYTLPELGYDYAALEPHISVRIMELHHSKNWLQCGAELFLPTGR